MSRFFALSLLLSLATMATAQTRTEYLEVDGQPFALEVFQDSSGIHMDAATFEVLLGLVRSLSGAVATYARLDQLAGAQDSLRAREVATMQSIIATERNRTDLYRSAYQDALEVGQGYRGLSVAAEDLARRRGRKGFWQGLGIGLVVGSIVLLSTR